MQREVEGVHPIMEWYARLTNRVISTLNRLNYT